LRCDDKTKHRLPAGKSCKSKEEIDAMLSYVKLGIQQPQSYLDFDDYDHPIRTVMEYKVYSLENYSLKQISLSLSKAILLDTPF